MRITTFFNYETLMNQVTLLSRFPFFRLLRVLGEVRTGSTLIP